MSAHYLPSTIPGVGCTVVDEVIHETFTFRNKDCTLLEKPTAAQTANTGWEREELGGTNLCQPSQEYARKTCNLLQARNERAEAVRQPRSQFSM